MKYVYRFDEGDATMKDLLGGKGANLAEMTRMGLPVPQGFTITTKACKEYISTGQMPARLMDQVSRALADLERASGRTFGAGSDPLLLSVRSGARFSMPGMMDTVLNLGLNDATVGALASASGDERFALDSYRRLLQMFGDVVLGIEHEVFEEALGTIRREEGADFDNEISVAGLAEVIAAYKRAYSAHGVEFPQDPRRQLALSIEAVFRSWDNPRAKTYRRLNGIPDDIGTAVNVQRMVFGNMGAGSATGVAFTRNPATGERERYGEYLLNAQGEDVVAGIRTPRPIAGLAEDMPEVWERLSAAFDELERHYAEMQDFEFTVERGHLHILQTRTGKRTAQAAVKIAVDMLEEGLIDVETSLMRVKPEQLEMLLHRQIDPKAKHDPVTRGLSASPGATAGQMVFTADDAVEWNGEGKRVILVRIETKPDDIHGFDAAAGILTSTGGMTSHAAVVARAMGKPCIAGAEALRIDYAARRMTVGDIVICEGDVVTIDGTRGEVMVGELPMVEAKISGDLARFLANADRVRRLGIRANADTPESAAKAIEFGAEGIGLCRTERMFNAVDRLPSVQQMILSKDADERRSILDTLFAFQKADFREILSIMDGKPVIVRLLDPPLHEFLPTRAELEAELDALRTERSLARVHGRAPDVSSLPRGVAELVSSGGLEAFDGLIAGRMSMLASIEELAEVNPMLGLRGVRLGITHPDIYEMQIRAIATAAAELVREGKDPRPEVMVPQVTLRRELDVVKRTFDRVVAEVVRESGVELHIEYGTMIETVRACLVAEDLAGVADFFSFGTNDLTQATFSFSREDAEAKFLPFYETMEIIDGNPFQTLDPEGVAGLVATGVKHGRKKRKDLTVGICGEHGGDPASVHLFHGIGLDYVSCSPFRIPIARLAAAQAALEGKRSKGKKA